MRHTDTFTDNLDADPEVDAIDETINAPSISDREVIAPCYDGRGRLLPLFRLWMRDGYTLLSHAHTPGEAMGNAIDDARTIIERTGMARRMTNHEKRLATTVDCWQQVG